MRLPAPLPTPLGNLRLEQWKRLLEADEAVRTLTAAGTATAADGLIVCDATSAAFTVTLPPAASVKGKILAIKKIDSSTNAITVDGAGSETIEGSTTHSLSSQWDGAVYQSTGTGWILRST